MAFLVGCGGLFLLRHLAFQVVVVFLIKIKVWMTAGKLLLHDGDGLLIDANGNLICLLPVTEDQK